MNNKEIIMQDQVLLVPPPPHHYRKAKSLSWSAMGFLLLLGTGTGLWNVSCFPEEWSQWWETVVGVHVATCGPNSLDQRKGTNLKARRNSQGCIFLWLQEQSILPLTGPCFMFYICQFRNKQKWYLHLEPPWSIQWGLQLISKEVKHMTLERY